MNHSDSPSCSSRWRWRGYLVPVVLAACALSGCQDNTAKPAQAKPPEVFIALPTREVVTEFEEFTGRIMAVQTVEIRARVTGYLDKALFKDGTDVKEGELLFEVDPRSYKADAAKAAAAVVQSKAHLDRLNLQETRAKQLLKSKAMSQEEFELISFDRAEAEASLGAATATKELADLNLSFTKITAPLSGRISRRLVDPGNLVKADETPMATIVSLDPIYAYFDVDERTVLRLRRLIQEGKIPSARQSMVMVKLALADEEDFTIDGVINFVDNQVESSTGTLRVRAVIDNPKLLLSPGMFARLRFPVGVPHEALLVREEALGADQGQRFLYVVNAQDEIEYRRVKVGLLHKGQRVIETGINPTDRIVVTGLQRVRPKSKVTTKLAPIAPDLTAGAAPARELPAVQNVSAAQSGGKPVKPQP